MSKYQEKTALKLSSILSISILQKYRQYYRCQYRYRYSILITLYLISRATVCRVRFTGDQYLLEYLDSEHRYRMNIRARSEVGLGDPLSIVVETIRPSEYCQRLFLTILIYIKYMRTMCWVFGRLKYMCLFV